MSKTNFGQESLSEYKVLTILCKDMSNTIIGLNVPSSPFITDNWSWDELTETRVVTRWALIRGNIDLPK